MKRIISAFILIGTLMVPLLFPVTVSAEVTTLSTSVPKQVTLSVEITGKGTVTVNGHSSGNNATYPVNRLENISVLVTADSDYLLKAVYLDGADVTDVLNHGLLTIENIQFDTDLTVVFTQKSSCISGTNPATGDLFHLYEFLLCWFGSLIMLMLLLLSKRNQKQ